MQSGKRWHCQRGNLTKKNREENEDKIREIVLHNMLAPELPATIKIDDIISGRVEPEAIYRELDRLKVEVDVLRHDMTFFLRALADISDGRSQQEYYKLVESRLKGLKDGIRTYNEQYVRLLPIINLAQIKLGHEVEVLPAKATSDSLKPLAPAATRPPPVQRRVSASKGKGTPHQPIVL